MRIIDILLICGKIVNILFYFFLEIHIPGYWGASYDWDFYFMLEIRLLLLEPAHFMLEIRLLLLENSLLMLELSNNLHLHQVPPLFLWAQSALLWALF